MPRPGLRPASVPFAPKAARGCGFTPCSPEPRSLPARVLVGPGATEGIDVSGHRPLARLDAMVLKLWAEEGLAAGPQAGQWAGWTS